MGHPGKLKKKYKTPYHPWQRLRMEKETKLKDFYALKNKKEVWKVETKLKNFTGQAKKVIREKTEQSKKEGRQLMERLKRLNLLESERVEDVLNLTIENIMDRRLQTQVFKLGLARSMKQSRQLILHGHIFVSGKKMTVPSYLLNKNDTIAYNPRSSFSNPEHPERVTEKKVITKIETKQETPGVEQAVENG